jgi:hypothetical protein
MDQNNNILSDNDRKKLDDIVVKMISENRSKQEIQATVDNFKNQYGLKKKESTQLGSGDGKSVLPSKEDELSPLQKAVKAGAEKIVEQKPETVSKPVAEEPKQEDFAGPLSFTERIGMDFEKNRPNIGRDVFAEKTAPLGIPGQKPELSAKEELPTKAKAEKSVQPITEESKTKYLWDSVRKDVETSTSITPQEHFKRLSDDFANNYLDEDQKQEYNYVQGINATNQQVKNLQKELQKNPNNAAIQLSLSKAIATKAQQETEYTKYKEAKYKKIDDEISYLEKMVNTSPLFSSFFDNFLRDNYINKIKQLKAEKENFFLDENALVQKKYSENKTALDKFEIPGNTPKEKLQNYYLTLNKERDIRIQELKKNYGEDVLTSTGGAIQAQLATYLGTDENVSKLLAIDEKMKSLAPVVLINRNPVKDVNEGFVESTLKSATQTLFPSTQYVISTPSELAGHVKQSISLAGLSDDLLSKTTGELVTEKAKGPEGLSREWFGNIAGTALGMAPYFTAGTNLVKGVSKLGQLPLYQRYLKGTKFGKYLVSDPVITGLGYKAAGYLMPSNSLVKDEATFLSGFFGGIAQAGIEKFLNTSYISQMFNKLFANKAEEIAIQVAKNGKRISDGIGETFEETGNTVGQMVDAWIATGDFQKLKSDFIDNFGSMDKNLELFVGSFTMGAIMGSGTTYGKTATAKSRDYYNNLSASDKKKADSFVQRVTQERYNAMVAAKKDEIKNSGAKAEPVTPKDLTDRQDAIDVLTNQESTPEERRAALSILADVDIKIENNKITKAAEAELKAGDTSTEVKPEDAVMEPIPSAEGTITTSEGTVEPAATETKPLEEGDQVQLEPQTQGGMPRVMEFKNGTWQQKIGNEYTTVSKEVQQEAQNLYDSQNKQRVSGEVRVGQEPVKAEPIEGGRQEAPSPSGNVQAPEEVTKPSLVTPEVVDNFINTGQVENDVLTSIAQKIKNNEALTKDENTIFSGKVSEVNKILTQLKDVAGTVELKSMEMANKNVSKFLQDSDIDVNILDTQEAFDQALKDEGQAAERGTEGAFVGKSGKIFINKSALGKGWAKTILYHEATHPVINIIRNTNPAKYKALVNGIKELEKTNKDVKEALDWAKDQYKNYPEGTIEDEGIVEVIARVADGKIKFGQIEPTLREKIVDFINQIAKAIGLPPITSKTDTETFKKTARQVADAMRKGKSISKVVGKENVTKYQYEAISGLGSQFSITKFGKSGVKKSPVLDKDEYKKKVQNGTLKISSPQEALGDSTFMLTFPDDLFVGDIFIGNNKVADFGGGVVYAIVEGEKGRMWASVSEKTAKAFADNVNKSLKINNGTSYVVLVKGADTKHVSSMSAKVGFMKTLLRYAEKNESMANGLLTAIKEIYSIGNVAKPELAIKRFDNYLEGGRGEDGQTMKEAKSAYDGLRSALIKYANPLITKMALEMGYGNEYFNGTKLKGKNPVYEASNLTVDKMFADLLQEDFLRGVPAGEAYAVIKTNSEVTIKNDLSHPSYPWVILTKDGSPVTLELFDKTFMTYGKNEAITGRYNEPTEGPTGGFGQVSYTIPKFKLNPDKKLQGPGTTDLLGALSKYKAISESESQAQKSMGGRQGLETSEKETTFAQDETRKQKGITPRGQRVDRQVGSDSSRMGTESSRTRGFQRIDSKESRRVGSRTVKVSAIYKPTSSLIDGIKSAIPKATIDSEILEITSSPEEFHRLISNAKAINEHGASVFVYEDETTRQHQYDGMRLFITPDGKAGLALKPNGDLVSGFNTKDKTKPNRLPQLILLAIKEGATKTDAFNTVLPNYYSKFGFRAVAKSTFNDEFAPKEYKDIYGNKQVGWDYETYKDFQGGRPDVVYFVYDGGDRATIQDRVGTFEPYSDYENIVPLVSDPDEGAAMQDKAMGKAQASKGGRNLAPNGKPSNLNDVQYKQVRTPEFKAWFGDWENDPQNASKIVDENGEPRVVYTGTSKDKDFDTFKLPRNGAWFTTDPQSASEYAVENDSQITKFDPFTGYRDLNTRPRVIPVFLNIRKPGDFIKLTTEEQRQKISYSSNYRKLQGDTFKNIYFENEIGNRYDGLYYTKDKSVIVVIESPNQIKSAIGNSGKFSPISDKIQFSQGGRETVVVDGAQQRVASVPDSLSIVDGFYSPIEKRITEFKQPKASATKWKEIVGSKSDEAVFSGIADWLNTFKPDQQISKEEVQNFIKKNRVEIKQVIKADNWREFYDERMAEVEKEMEYFRAKGFDAYTISRTPDAMFDKLNDADQDRLIDLKAERDFLNDVYFDYGNSRQTLTGAQEEDMPKYIKYINPGDAQNYKEILVIAPVISKYEKIDKYITNKLNDLGEQLNTARTYKKVGDTGTVSDFELVITDQEKFDRLTKEKDALLKQDKANYLKLAEAKNTAYRSSHYNEKNIVVHTRTDVRRDSNDNKVFFIEEVQSDWGQEGLKKGFREPKEQISPSDVVSINQEGKLWIINFGDKVSGSIKVPVDIFPSKELAIDNAVMNVNGSNYLPGLAKAPYVTNTNAWTKLGLKIALQQAVKEGADKIAWTTGEQQNKRYDLSKQVDAVTYEKNDDGTYNIDGLKNNRSVSYKENVQADQLESMLGKDVAERIINDEGDKPSRYFDSNYTGRVRVLTGDQLTVGGKGMTAFYGNMETPGILGSVAKALVKELTGVEPKIEGTALGYSLDQEDEVIKTLDEYDNSLKKGGIFYHYGEVLTKSQALEYIERGLKIGVSYPKADIQPSIVITPELRAAVEKGMPQFSRGERGAAKTENTKDVVSEAVDLFYKVRNAEGSAKKRALADERKALLSQNPSVKYIDDNIKTILDQLEAKEVATRKGNCP